RAGQRRTNEGEQSEPIFTTSSFTFESAEQAAARFGGDDPGNIYSRFTNPTVEMFEDRLAALEGGERCVATASGMAAISTTFLGLLNAGDHVVSSRAIFGSTTVLFDKILSRLGISVTYVSLTDLDEWRAAVQPETRMFYLETPSNPLTEIADIPAIAEIAHAHDCLLAVDNVYATPILQRPLEMGADLVIHSATKYIDGQGRCLGGAVVGAESLVGEGVYGYVRTAGPSMSPFNAWVFLKGLETLELRMERHCRNAMEIARWLDAQSKVKRVNYPGLESHPQHELAKRQQSDFGGVLSFEVEGGKAGAFSLINGTRLLSITANLGDAKSTITHPGTTTHGRLSEEERALAGISDGLVRISAGLETVADLIADLERGLAAI
ncbi:MAG: O-succinylhomoserine sulfhydrylase, partial [Gammaproteobacteria bacterium]